MRITIATVTYNIPFMFADPKDIRHELQQMLAIDWERPEKFHRRHGNTNLCFIIILNRETVELEIKGPTTDKKLIDFAIWLPYKKINSSNNYRLSYISYIEEGMRKVLSKYEFNIEPFDSIFSKLKEKELEGS